MSLCHKWRSADSPQLGWLAHLLNFGLLPCFRSCLFLICSIFSCLFWMTTSFLVWTYHKNLEYIRTTLQSFNSQQATLLHKIQLHALLSLWVLQCKTWCPVPTIQKGGNAGKYSSHPSVLFGGLAFMGDREGEDTYSGASQSHCLSFRLSGWFKVRGFAVGLCVQVNLSPKSIMNTRGSSPAFFVVHYGREYAGLCKGLSGLRPKQSRQALPDVFCPLPVPHHPRSHIALDFVSDLPPSNGNTMILSVIDGFIKMTSFVQLPKLHSAKEMAQFILMHIFRLHGIPANIVSDCGS